MGRLILVKGAAEGGRENEYRERFAGRSPQELIDAYNADVGSSGWVAARGRFLIALREALLATGLDCSAFIDEDGMKMSGPIMSKEDRIVFAEGGDAKAGKP